MQCIISVNSLSLDAALCPWQHSKFLQWFVSKEMQFHSVQWFSNLMQQWHDLCVLRSVSAGMQQHVMSFEVGGVLEDSKWQAPARCFSDQHTVIADPGAATVTDDRVEGEDGKLDVMNAFFRFVGAPAAAAAASVWARLTFHWWECHHWWPAQSTLFLPESCCHV